MDQSQWIVIGISGVAFVIGVVLMIMGILASRKLQAIEDTPTVDAAQAAQMADPEGTSVVELRGTAESDMPLTSPATGSPCLYFRHKVEQLVRHYDRDTDGSQHTDESWETVSDTERRTPFVVRDQSGAIMVSPERAEFVAELVMNDQPGTSGFDRGGDSLGDSVGGVLGGVIDAVTSGPHSGMYRTSEWVIRLGVPVYVLGSAVRSGSQVMVQKGEGPFIVSYKSEEELTSKYRLHYILYLVFGVLLGAGGAGGAIYATQFMKK